MVETIASSNASQSQQQKPVAREDIADGFSFAAAMTALEGRASIALQTYGASPNGAAPGQNAQSASGPANNAGGQVQERVVENNQSPQQRNAASEPARTPQPAQAEATPQQHSGATAHTQQANIAVTAAAPTAAIQPAIAAASRAEAPAMREAALAKASTAKAPRPLQQAQTTATTQNFAHLLAKKLTNGATSFELRLDPPHLGRVDAQLTLGDDGEAVVALRFENQDTLDLFARDEAGLRTALSFSGQDFDRRQFSFSLIEADDPAAPAASDASTSNYEPVFAASYSTGAVDLRL